MDGAQAIGGTDTITLRLPGDQDLRGVASLVVGGVAVRLDLTLESLEDLEIAVETLLDQAPRDEEVTLVLGVADGSLSASVGPVDGPAIRAELEGEPADGVGLRRVLQTVASRFEVVERDGASWLSIEKDGRAESGEGGGAP